MQIKNIFFPLPVIVDLINNNGEEERKLIFYDQTNNNFLPLDDSINYEDLEFICKNVSESFKNSSESNVSDENFDENLLNLTDLNKIPNLIKKVQSMKENKGDKFRKDKHQS